MAGIGMCNRVGNECPVKEKCLRFKGEPYFQTDVYNFYPQVCNSENKYEQKWELKLDVIKGKEESK